MFTTAFRRLDDDDRKEKAEAPLHGGFHPCSPTNTTHAEQLISGVVRIVVTVLWFLGDQRRRSTKVWVLR